MLFYQWGEVEARAFAAGILLGLSLSLWVYLSTHRDDESGGPS